MGDSAVAILMNKLGNLVESEREMLREIWEDIEYIKDELARIRPTMWRLDEENSSEEVKEWVEEVAGVANDTIDLVDELTLPLTHLGGEEPAGYLDNVSYYIKGFIARHRIAPMVQSINSRVQNISETHESICHRFNIQEKRLSSVTARKTWFDPRGDALLLEDADLVGISEPKKQLMRLLMEGDSRLNVISVVGMGGLGKTTLVKNVYDDHRVRRHFRFRAWIKVSRSYKTEDLLNHLLQQLFHHNRKSTPQQFNTTSYETMKVLIKDFLQRRKYLIVFDDVWSLSAWHVLKYALPINKLGCRVMLTTRDVEVATITCTESRSPDNVYRLKSLSEEESWTLFCQKTFRGNSCPPYLEPICHRIVKRCEGLPLAIVAMGNLLATKDESRIDEWEMVYSNLGAEMESNYRLHKFRETLSLSYIYLPYYLKDCFLYLGIFPQDHPIECERLMRLWIAEGFVKEKKGRVLEDVAEDYLNVLFNKNLIQIAETSDGRFHECRIHSLVHEIILLESRAQNIAVVAREQQTRWPERIRRLSVHNNSNIVRDKNLSQLRSLFLFGDVDSVSNLPMKLLFHRVFKLLKVLEMRGAHFEKIADEVFSLINLRYLSLRDTNVKVLPRSVGNLINLETLDLKRTCIAELPSEISELQQLRHLLVYHYTLESYMPYHYLNGFNLEALAGIGKLQSLQKLCFIELNQGSIMVEELGRLKELRRLGITKLRMEDGMALSSSIQKLTNLRSLNIHSVDEEEIIDMQNLSSPPPLLQRLYLHGRLERLPDWIVSLNSLVKLFLRWSQLREDPLESLGVLPNLIELQLRQAYQGEELSFKGGWFQKLKVLLLDELEELRRVTIEKEAMPFLEDLTIMHCQFLEEIPSGTEHLKNLKSMQFFDMPNQLHESLLPNQKNQHYRKVSHIPQVSFVKWENSHWETHTLKLL